jgi:dihydrofolate reductase
VKITLVFVSTLDGKITKWGDPHVMKWSSKEDQEYFKQTWKNFRVILMGSGTFDAEPFKPPKNNRLIIMTVNPAKYKELQVLGSLEFTDESPVSVATRLKEEGHEEVLLVGGPHLATSFLKEELVDELWLTLEPKIFASGGNFVVEDKLDVNLKLKSHEKVNEQGTLILKYEVLRH